MTNKECKIMKYICKSYGEGELTNEEFTDFIMELLISENGFTNFIMELLYVIEYGNANQVNAVVALKLYEKIKKHPKLWKIFMVA